MDRCYTGWDVVGLGLGCFIAVCCVVLGIIVGLFIVRGGRR
jgi:hypothetical protein